ncbi:ThiF family adenylyltransferase [Kitasatospora fiedleri]|uniref:ThiF family adenylyltransferase n=1 Tax=Kitasatospora fiedleri TaxID=2991545 RepID=UPI00249A2CE4|nr:ThiF family adenylyltransferase [Kitasatospora fiedleri]
MRTDRNRDKITREEQRHLLGRRIGVIGLSVGSSAALTCAMEGVGGSFRLADFDRLSLSNLNRLRAGVHEIGLEKTVICARRLYELDPYLDVSVHRHGVSEESIEEFFAPGRDGAGWTCSSRSATPPGSRRRPANTPGNDGCPSSWTPTTAACWTSSASTWNRNARSSTAARVP